MLVASATNKNNLFLREKKMNITMSQFIEMLFAVANTTFIGFNSITVPSMRKTNNRFVGLVEKCSTVNALIGYCYQNMVDNAQKRQLSADLRATLLDNGVPESAIDGFENDLSDIVDQAHQQFKTAGLQWGKYMLNTLTGKLSPVLIDHTNKQEVYRVYAQMAIMQTKDPVYRWIGGKELTSNELSEMKEFFPKKKEGERQGLAKPYIIRSYALDNVKSVRMNKQSFQLVG